MTAMTGWGKSPDTAMRPSARANHAQGVGNVLRAPVTVGGSWVWKCKPEVLASVAIGAVPADAFVKVVRKVVEADPGRLKPVFWEAESQSWLAGWYDSELQVDCSFELAADQELHCLPLQVAGGVWSAFSDETCSVRTSFVALDACAPELPTFTRWPVSGSCPRQTDVVPLGAALAAEALPPLWQERSAGCVPEVPPAAYTYLPVGDALQPDMFVRAEPRIE